MKDLAIGIFDSGMGGISVLAEMINLMPNEKYIYFGDSKNAPYGPKSKEEIKMHSNRICDFLVSKGVKAIVVACNTATSAAIEDLRLKYEIPIIGMEPALKPALDLNSEGKILVMATEMTLKEKKFNKLAESLGNKDKVIKLPCPGLVTLVEGGNLDSENVKTALDECFSCVDLSEVGSIVLGCTHFIFLKRFIEEYANVNLIIDGNKGTSRHLKNILQSKGQLNDCRQERKNEVLIYNSSSDKSKMELSKKLLEIQIENLSKI